MYSDTPFGWRIVFQASRSELKWAVEEFASTRSNPSSTWQSGMTHGAADVTVCRSAGGSCSHVQSVSGVSASSGGTATARRIDARSQTVLNFAAMAALLEFRS